MLYPKRPSISLNILRSAVSSGKLKRGYGWLLQNIPSCFWGGASLIIKTNIGDMTLPTADPGSAGLLLFGQIVHEVNETNLVRKLSKNFNIAVDIGSHAGWYARLIWATMSDEKDIYAFEPNPYIYSFLLENVKNYAGIFPSPVAISDIDGPITFYCAKSSNLSSAIRYQVGKPISVNSMRLDTFCEDKGLLGKLDFIKCDVEGGELSVLRGAKRVRSMPNSPIWMLEADKGFLNEAGTSIHELNNEIHMINDPVHIFYIRPNGVLVEITHVSEAQAPNIFIIPEKRLEQFVRVAVGR